MDYLLELIGQHISLKPLMSSDEANIIKAASDGELWNLTFTVVPSAKTAKDYIDKAIVGRNEKTVIPFVIVDNATNKVIGSTRFWKVDLTNRKLEIGHTWYSESYQRTYANTEAKYLLLKYAFEELKCVRVQFTTDELNEKSRNAILRIGAKQEGVVRNERIMPNGRIRNAVRFSIIDSEWEQIKKSLIRRLNKI
ncbi:MAG: GNAT family N-acetyltransferase [Polynucleobacter sp.]|uniref:GNAT family N-acetyltransferase n=1 Tax=Polynucleobacter sp. TaxID=2029855 RepID=UPI00216E6E7B|nr:GNAT family protein [Polynucleobacter sp.]MBU3670321.1 GNAT family N-acetyltransferase [Polynucleobacter sp.]